MKFNASMLKTFSKCSLQGAFRYVDKIDKYTLGSSAHFGTSVHLALEHLHNGGTVEESQKIFRDYFQSIKPDYWNRRTKETTMLDLGPKMIAEYYESVKWENQITLGTEFRFMVPFGDHTLSGIIDHLHTNDNYDILYIDDLKGLALDTKLPTPTGWTTMGEVQVGDMVIGSDGKPCKVIKKSKIHYKDCYKLIFEDGVSVICDYEHLWKTLSGTPKLKEKVLSTLDIKNSLFKGKQRQHRIVNCQPLDLEISELQLNPYILGYWLGNGKHSSSEITSGDQEIFDYIKSLGFTLGSNTNYKDSNCETRTIHGIAGSLRFYNLIKNKHIPIEFLRASLEDRLQLLRGLMDSDGTWNSGRKQAIFTSTSEILADGVLELVASLGWRAYKNSFAYKGFNVTGTAYTISFTPFNYNPFVLSRKALACQFIVDKPPVNANRRIIQDIVPILTVPTQCIAVDSSDNTYLCTEHMIPTHNTGAQPNLDNLHLDIQWTTYHWAVQQKEFWCGMESDDPNWPDKYAGFPNGEELFEKFQKAQHIGRWVNLKKMSFVNVGPRDEFDFARLYRMCDMIERAVETKTFVPSINGDACTFCDYHDECPVYFESPVSITTDND